MNLSKSFELVRTIRIKKGKAQIGGEENISTVTKPPILTARTKIDQTLTIEACYFQMACNQCHILISEDHFKSFHDL